MGSRSFPLPPLLTLSTRAASLVRLPTYFRIAEEARVDGIDLDFAGRPLPSSIVRLVTHAEASDAPVRSVWVPRSSAWTAWRRDRSRRLAAELAAAMGAAALVIDLPAMTDGKISRSVVTSVTESLRANVGPATQVTVAIGAARLEGGRGHLVQLTSLRRLAEEWDFDIALDLLGRIDPRWEAEAAVARLGTRLSLIRLGGDIASGPAQGRWRGAARALATALDSGHAMTFALAPTVAPWQGAWAPAVARACAAAGTRIMDRYSAVEEQRVLDSFPNPRPHYRG